MKTLKTIITLIVASLLITGCSDNYPYLEPAEALFPQVKLAETCISQSFTQAKQTLTDNGYSRNKTDYSTDSTVCSVTYRKDYRNVAVFIILSKNSTTKQYSVFLDAFHQSDDSPFDNKEDFKSIVQLFGPTYTFANGNAIDFRCCSYDGAIQTTDYKQVMDNFDEIYLKTYSKYIWKNPNETYWTRIVREVGDEPFLNVDFSITRNK